MTPVPVTQAVYAVIAAMIIGIMLGVGLGTSIELRREAEGIYAGWGGVPEPGTESKPVNMFWDGTAWRMENAPLIALGVCHEGIPKREP